MEIETADVVAALLVLTATAGVIATAVFLFQAGVGQGKFLIAKMRG